MNSKKLILTDITVGQNNFGNEMKHIFFQVIVVSAIFQSLDSVLKSEEM